MSERQGASRRYVHVLNFIATPNQGPKATAGRRPSGAFAPRFRRHSDHNPRPPIATVTGRAPYHASHTQSRLKGNSNRSIRCPPTQITLDSPGTNSSEAEPGSGPITRPVDRSRSLRINRSTGSLVLEPKAFNSWFRKLPQKSSKWPRMTVDSMAYRPVASIRRVAQRIDVGGGVTGVPSEHRQRDAIGPEIQQVPIGARPKVQVQDVARNLLERDAGCHVHDVSYWAQSDHRNRAPGVHGSNADLVTNAEAFGDLFEFRDPPHGHRASQLLEVLASRVQPTMTDESIVLRRPADERRFVPQRHGASRLQRNVLPPIPAHGGEPQSRKNQLAFPHSSFTPARSPRAKKHARNRVRKVRWLPCRKPSLVNRSVGPRSEGVE